MYESKSLTLSRATPRPLFKYLMLALNVLCGNVMDLHQRKVILPYCLSACIIILCVFISMIFEMHCTGLY